MIHNTKPWPRFANISTFPRFYWWERQMRKLQYNVKLQTKISTLRCNSLLKTAVHIKSHDASFCNWCLYPLRHTCILFISTDSSILSGKRLLQESHNSYMPVNRTHICPYVPIPIHNDCHWFSFTYHILLLQRGASKRLLLVQLPYKHICYTWILGRRYPIVNRSVLDNPKISLTCDAIHWIGIDTAL